MKELTANAVYNVTEESAHRPIFRNAGPSSISTVHEKEKPINQRDSPASVKLGLASVGLFYVRFVVIIQEFWAYVGSKTSNRYRVFSGSALNLHDFMIKDDGPTH